MVAQDECGAMGLRLDAAAWQCGESLQITIALVTIEPESNGLRYGMIRMRSHIGGPMENLLFRMRGVQYLSGNELGFT